MGFFVPRLIAFSEQTAAQLAILIVDILLPVYLFYTIATADLDEIFSSAPQLLITTLLIAFISLLVAWLFLKTFKQDLDLTTQRLILFCILFANTAFVAFPICEALYGKTGLVYAIIYDTVLTWLTFSLGIWILSGKTGKEFYKAIFNPVIIGALLGLVWAILGLQLPAWAAKPMQMIGGATMPMALMMVGIQMGIRRGVAVGISFPIFFAGLMRLLIVPLATWFALRFVWWDPVLEAIIILQSGMPVAISATIVAKRYQHNATLTAANTFWTTLTSLITLPLLALLIRL